MEQVKHIATELGRDVIADALGVRVTAVSNSIGRGKFPASWYPVIAAMCEKAGVECNESAFNFKTPSQNCAEFLACEDEHGNATDQIQGGAA